MVSIFLIYLMGGLEKLSFYYLNKLKHFQDIILTGSFYLIGITLILSSFFLYGFVDFSFLTDYRVYITFLLEIISFKLAKFNYQHQGNYTAISFSQMTSMWLIFPIGFFLDSILGYENTLLLDYDSGSQVLLYSGVFFVSTIFYFYDKLNFTSIKYPIPLYSLGVSLTFTMYFAVKNMQTHQATTLMGVTFLLMSIVFVFDILFNKKKRKRLKKISKKKIKFFYFYFYMLFIIVEFMAIYIITLVSVEVLTMFKRNGQLIVGNIIDYKHNKEKMNKKDIIVVIFTLLFSLYIYMVH